MSEPFDRYVLPADKVLFQDLIKAGLQNDVKGEISLIHDNVTIPVQLSITALKVNEADTLSMIVTDLTHQKEK